MGRMIVIDGLDGSGKATQAELLKNRLKEKGYDPIDPDRAGLILEDAKAKYLAKKK